MDENFKKALAFDEYNKKVLEAMLVASMTKDKIFFPTEKEYILSEFVNGAIAYLGGRAGEYTYSVAGKWEGLDYERKLCDYHERATKGKLGGLHPKIALTMAEFTRSRVEVSGPWSDRDVINGLYSIYRLGGLKSVAALPYDVIVKGKETLAGLSEGERRDVIGIGKKMRPFIEADLKEIKVSHLW